MHSLRQQQHSKNRNDLQRALELKRILEDPCLFAKVMLGQDLWPRQQEILQSLTKHRRTAVKACHASGKTFTAAVAVLWWLAHRREGVVITTAPTWVQVQRVLWGEIHSLVQQSRYPFPKPSATHLRLGSHRYAMGLSTNQGVRFQGFHGEILIVLDEAPGILPDIYAAIEGIMAGGTVRILAIGNPVIASGPFYDAFTTARENWNLLTISAFDTPNLTGLDLESVLALSEEELDTNLMPYLTSRRWVKEKYSELGPDHPTWESRVLAQFPRQSDNALFSLTWLEQAKVRDTPGEGDLWAGLDVAGPGEDETVLCIRQGSRILALHTWAQSDPRGRVVAALAPFKDRLKAVNVDSVGIGWGMACHLHELGFPVTYVNVGIPARDTEKFANLKAEIYWGFRQRLAAGDLAGLDNDKAITQLASILYTHNPRGQITIEKKEEARKRVVKSPDRAEAIILAFAGGLKLGQGLLDWMERELKEKGV